MGKCVREVWDDGNILSEKSSFAVCVYVGFILLLFLKRNFSCDKNFRVKILNIMNCNKYRMFAVANRSLLCKIHKNFLIHAIDPMGWFPWNCWFAKIMKRGKMLFDVCGRNSTHYNCDDLLFIRPQQSNHFYDYVKNVLKYLQN